MVERENSRAPSASVSTRRSPRKKATSVAPAPAPAPSSHSPILHRQINELPPISAEPALSPALNQDSTLDAASNPASFAEAPETIDSTFDQQPIVKTENPAEQEIRPEVKPLKSKIKGEEKPIRSEIKVEEKAKTEVKHEEKPVLPKKENVAKRESAV